MKADWKDWCVSFTHFVQLAEHPSEDCLWAMLARRAAGAFPRGQKGVDLVIPICTSKLDKNGKSIEARVSMIVVQVKNWENADSSFPMSATKGTRPSSIFKRGDYAVPAAKQAFQALKPDSVIRVYMSLRDSNVGKFYLRDDFRADCPDDSLEHCPSYVLCMQGLSAWSTSPVSNLLPGTSTSTKRKKKKSGSTPGRRAYQVLSDGVCSQLQAILQPWWKVAGLVKEDVLVREKKQLFGMKRSDLIEFAQKPLAESMLLNDAKTTARKSTRLGRVTSDSAAGGSAATDSKDTSPRHEGRAPSSVESVPIPGRKKQKT